jgi:hypothetical protein
MPPTTTTTEIAVVGTWHRGAVHIWGWDGDRPMPVGWFYGEFRHPRWPDTPLAHGHLTSLELVAPDGEHVRPSTVRLDPGNGPWWLSAIGRADRAAHPSLAWFAALADLAAATVGAGRVSPAVRDEGVMRVARWMPVLDDILTHALDQLATAAPAVCLMATSASVTEIHAALVDGVARRRLYDAGWRPALPAKRSPEITAQRFVLGGLTKLDPTIRRGSAAVDVEIGELATAFDRRARRAGGEPVVLPRLRLVVPDEPDDDWGVVLELVDALDRGRWCSAADVWEATPLAVELAGHERHLPVLATVLTETAQMVGAAVDVLGELTRQHEPAGAELDLDAAEAFLEQAPAALDQLGVELIGPERLVKAGVAVRGTATPAPTDDRPGRFDRDAIVQWSLTVADGDGPAAISAAELARAEASGATLLRSGRRWVRIDPAALRRARSRLVEHRQDHERVDAVTLLRLAANEEAADPGTDAVTAEMAGAAWAEELLAGLPDERLNEEHEPSGFAGELRHYQRRGLAWLRFLERLGLGGCLADDMGLGKTATTLAHLLDRPGPHLVVCPLSVVRNWESEAARFAPSMRVVVHHGADRHGAETDDLAGADLVVTTYGLLPRDVDHLSAVAWSTVVIDEAQAIKNPATQAARAVRRLRSGQRIALTGTPVENRLAELWAILDAVNPGMLGSRERFRRRFAAPIERSADSEAAARLRRLTQPFVLRRSKADRQLVPDLPDKIEQVAWAGLTREQGVLYQHVVDQLLADAATTDGMRRRGLVLAALTRLKQICNHPAHALGDGSRLGGRSGKLTRFDELVDELLDVGERALVFTQFREMGVLLQRHLQERIGLQAPFLHGGVSRARRDDMVASFQAGTAPPILLVSLKAGGTGVNLTAASQVIHYDRWWNPAVEDQATDRAWRIGQGRTVMVHKLVCEGTVEERIGRLIDDKRALADAVVGSGEAWLSELSTAELRELVHLDRAEP